MHPSPCLSCTRFIFRSLDQHWQPVQGSYICPLLHTFPTLNWRGSFLHVYLTLLSIYSHLSLPFDHTSQVQVLKPFSRVFSRLTEQKHIVCKSQVNQRLSIYTKSSCGLNGAGTAWNSMQDPPMLWKIKTNATWLAGLYQVQIPAQHNDPTSCWH